MVPDKLEIDLTKRCNLNCVHCSREASPEADTEGELTPLELFHLVKQAGEIGVPALTLMGGEPTTHPYFLELAFYARHCGINYVSTSTNGLLVDDEKAKMMATIFSDVQVSLHGATAEVHDRIVGRDGAFALATRAVELLRHHGANDINISFSVMQENRHQMREMISLAKKLGGTSIRFLGLTSEGRGACLPQLNWNDRQEISDFIRTCREERDESGKLAIEGGGFPIYMPFNDSAAFYGCPAGRTLMYVDSTGLSGICSVLPMRFGSVRDASLLDLWHQPAIRRFRQKISCDCPYKVACSGGCLGADTFLEKFPEVPSDPVVRSGRRLPARDAASAEGWLQGSSVLSG
jgi:radical SAM protein with 4Fe4S-binding SPASM domain